MPTWRTPILWHLDDHTPVLLRPVLPEDKPRFQQALESLSPDSRYLRFFAPVKALSPEQLRFFTEVDQADHLAWCAVDSPEEHQRGLGVARCVRSDDDPQAADFALTVLDDYQSRGLGRTLLALLVLQATGQGVQRFRGEVSWQNHRFRQWMLNLGAHLTREADCDLVELLLARATLPDNPTAQRFANTLVRLRTRLESKH